jgi:hypothetical protein
MTPFGTASLQPDAIKQFHTTSEHYASHIAQLAPSQTRSMTLSSWDLVLNKIAQQQRAVFGNGVDFPPQQVAV